MSFRLSNKFYPREAARIYFAPICRFSGLRIKKNISSKALSIMQKRGVSQVMQCLEKSLCFIFILFYTLAFYILSFFIHYLSCSLRNLSTKFFSLPIAIFKFSSEYAYEMRRKPSPQSPKAVPGTTATFSS
jgi:hypothetical protein